MCFYFITKVKKTFKSSSFCNISNFHKSSVWNLRWLWGVRLSIKIVLLLQPMFFTSASFFLLPTFIFHFQLFYLLPTIFFTSNFFIYFQPFFLLVTFLFTSNLFFTSNFFIYFQPFFLLLTFLFTSNFFFYF